MSFKLCGFILILTVLFLIPIEVRGRFGLGRIFISGGFRRGHRLPELSYSPLPSSYHRISSPLSSYGLSSPYRSDWISNLSSRKVTPNPSYSRSHAFAAPTQRSSYVGSQKAAHFPTPRYVVRTQPNVHKSPSQNYPSQSYPSQKYPASGHTTPRFFYSTQRSYYPTQSSDRRIVYNRAITFGRYYNRMNYGKPNYQNSYNSYSPYYTPSYSKYPNLYQPYERKRDHSVRNSVIAGLGGSALGMYLGFKIGSYTSGLHQPVGGYGYNGGYYNGGNGYSGMPSYSVVHHYHHGERDIPQNIEVKPNIISQCGNMTDFCTPNTSPLCITNETIYCVASKLLIYHV